MRIAASVGLVFVGLTVIGIATVITMRVSAARERDRRNAVEIETLRSEVAALRRSERVGPLLLRALAPTHAKGEQAEPAAPGAPNAATAQPPEPLPTLTPEERDQQAGTMIATYRQVLEESYLRETPDPEWARGAVTSLQGAYSDEKYKSMTLATECRATMCRVTFEYGDGPGVDWRDMMGNVPWPAASTGVFDETTRRGIFYVPREGYELPNSDLGAPAF